MVIDDTVSEGASAMTRAWWQVEGGQLVATDTAGHADATIAVLAARDHSISIGMLANERFGGELQTA